MKMTLSLNSFIHPSILIACVRKIVSDGVFDEKTANKSLDYFSVSGIQRNILYVNSCLTDSDSLYDMKCGVLANKRLGCWQY